MRGACQSARLSDYLSKIAELFSKAPAGHFTRDRQAFSRCGPLSPELLVTLLLYLVADAGRRGYQNLLDAFWDEARGYGMTLPVDAPVSAAAFCKARYKLEPALIRKLLHQVADDFDTRFGANHLWHGHRVFGVDGSRMSTQRSDLLWLAWGGAEGANNPQMLVSTLFQLFSEVPYDVSIGSYTSSERDHLLGHLDRLREGDVLVLDRGYPSYDLFSDLLARGIHFVVRMPTNSSFREVQQFARSEAKDKRLILQNPNPGRVGRPPSVTLRAISRSRTNDGDFVLLTDLVDRAYTPRRLDDLYHRRWQVEEFYKLEKGDYLGQRQFHALRPDGVRQEVLALALYMALTRLLMAQAATEAEAPYGELSQKTCVLAFAAYLTRLLLTSRSSSPEAEMAALLARMARTRIPKRPGRKYPRRSFRPRPRWNAFGKTGG